jgi:hypothetical protein
MRNAMAAGMVFDFLAECIRQPAEAAHAHPHLEV